MGKITDGVRNAAKKLSSTRLGWPKRKSAPVEKKQIDRWEGEGGSVADHPDESSG